MGELPRDTYGIGAVVRLTGLSDHTIRVWERRYSAVVAMRGPSGRRIYTIADVEKLKLLKLLTDRGLSIGQIANETSAALKKRLAAMNDIGAHAGFETLSVALAGDFLPNLLEGYEDSLGTLDFDVVAGSLDQLETDLRCRSVDALILELPTATAADLDRIVELRDLAAARICIVVYTFARSEDIERFSARDITPVRGPVGVEELRNALVKLGDAGRTPKTADEKPVDSGDWPVKEVPATRRFTREQLGRLSKVVTSIDCECPRHLAQLVADLTAFERYCASCANRDDDDRALHEYLHRTTAGARAEMEEALERVVRAEQLEF